MESMTTGSGEDCGTPETYPEPFTYIERESCPFTASAIPGLGVVIDIWLAAYHLLTESEWEADPK